MYMYLPFNIILSMKYLSTNLVDVKMKPTWQWSTISHDKTKTYNTDQI